MESSCLRKKCVLKTSTLAASVVSDNTAWRTTLCRHRCGNPTSTRKMFFGSSLSGRIVGHQEGTPTHNIPDQLYHPTTPCVQTTGSYLIHTIGRSLLDQMEQSMAMDGDTMDFDAVNALERSMLLAHADSGITDVHPDLQKLEDRRQKAEAKKAAKVATKSGTPGSAGVPQKVP